MTLEETQEHLSKPIISRNGNIAFTFEFHSDDSGIIKLLDTRIHRLTKGTFQLSYSNDVQKWFVNLECKVKIKTPNGEYPLGGMYIETLRDYINKISN